MKLITKDQIKKLHVLLNIVGVMNIKKEVISKFTGGRTESSRELTGYEAKRIIDVLENHARKNDPADKMRKKILSICYQLGWIEGDSREDKIMNMIIIDNFLMKRGTIKKPLKKYTVTELPKLVSQFEVILKNTLDTKASKAVKELLNELNITV